MNDQISPVSETPTSLIDRRLTDLREANDVFRGMDWDKSRDIQRNDREIRWLIDLRTVLTSDHAPSPREQALEKAAVEFIAKVDRGEARSTQSYAAFKAALADSSTVGNSK